MISDISKHYCHVSNGRQMPSVGLRLRNTDPTSVPPDRDHAIHLSRLLRFSHVFVYKPNDLGAMITFCSCPH